MEMHYDDLTQNVIKAHFPDMENIRFEIAASRLKMIWFTVLPNIPCYSVTVYTVLPCYRIYSVTVFSYYRFLLIHKLASQNV